MNRILDFSPSQEEAVVSRILVLVHQSIDDAFPSMVNANRKFTKTVFSEEGGEKTAAMRPADQFGSVEDTSPDGRNSDGATLPPPPPSRVPPPPPVKARGTEPPAAEKGNTAESAKSLSFNSQLNPMNKDVSRSTRLDSHMDRMGDGAGPDWVTRITLALLIAGLILLAYVLFV